MFLAFALMLALALRRRPRLLPWLMVVHAAMDASVTQMVIATSMG